MRNSLCTQTGAFEREAKAHQEEVADDDCEQTSDVDLMLRPSPPKEEGKYGAEQVEEDLALMVKGKRLLRTSLGQRPYSSARHQAHSLLLLTMTMTISNFIALSISSLSLSKGSYPGTLKVLIITDSIFS